MVTKSKFFIVTIFIFMILLCIYSQLISRKQGKEIFSDFYRADIDSYLESATIARKGTGIKLLDGRKFIFYPYKDEMLNRNSNFISTAEKGDKIIKKSYSDTLYLIKGNRSLRYLFNNFNIEN